MIGDIPDYQQPELSLEIRAQVQQHIESLSLLGYTILFNVSDFLRGQRKGGRAKLRWTGEAFEPWT